MEQRCPRPPSHAQSTTESRRLSTPPDEGRGRPTPRDTILVPGRAPRLSNQRVTCVPEGVHQSGRSREAGRVAMAPPSRPACFRSVVLPGLLPGSSFYHFPAGRVRCFDYRAVPEAGVGARPSPMPMRGTRLLKSGAAGAEKPC
jgi:hypothetical protein